MVEGRLYGRSRGEKDLREVLKAKKTVGKFVVLKSRKPNNLKSRFECSPKKVIKETEHTVTVEGGKLFHKKDVADCSQLMLDISFQKPNKTDRGIIRSTENGQFKRKSSNVDIPHTVGTGRDEGAKERKRKGLKNPHSQSWLEEKANAEKNKKLASTGSSDPIAQGDPVQSNDQSGDQTAVTTAVTDEMNATGGDTGVETMAVDAVDPQAQARDSADADKQVSCDGTDIVQSDAVAATVRPPIYSANAPIKPIPGNYTDNEDSSVVRRSNRLPTAKRVNKYGGVSYN